MRGVTLLVMTVIACDGSSGIAPDALVDPAPIDVAIDGCTVSTAPSSARHTKHVSTAQTQGYWEYLPADYACGGLRPLLVFLHGIGENGELSLDVQSPGLLGIKASSYLVLFMFHVKVLDACQRHASKELCAQQNIQRSEAAPL